MATPPNLLLPPDHPVYRVQRGAMIAGALGLIGCIAASLCKAARATHEANIPPCAEIR